MASQLFINPWPAGSDVTLHSQEVNGSILLAGSAVSTGEPVNWGNIISGVPYNNSNYLGKGSSIAMASALVTALSAAAGTITATAANNFIAGQKVMFAGCTSTLGAKLNGLAFTVATANSSQFTFASGLTGNGSSEVGFVYSGNAFYTQAFSGPVLTASVTSLSAANGVITVTAANSFLPGASVTFSGLSTVLGAKLNGVTFKVASTTGSAFTFASALTGNAGSDTGTATGQNVPQPVDVLFWSGNASGYVYRYQYSTGSLFVLQTASVTPAGTNSAPTITTTTGTPATLPVGVDGTGNLTQTSGATGIKGVQAPTFTGTATTAAALSALAAAAYPAGVLADLVFYKARFVRNI